jgi:adenosine deaminase
VEHLGFDDTELERLSLNALEASFLPDELKAKLAQSFQFECAELRSRHVDRKEPS